MMIRQRARRRTVIVLMSAAAAAFLVWQRVQATRFGYEVEAAHTRVRTLQGRLLFQGMEWEKAVAPAQLAHHARTRLRMQPAGPESIRMLDGGSFPSSPSSGAWAMPGGIFSTVRHTLSTLRRPT